MEFEHATKEELMDIKKWFFKENIRIEQQKKELEEEKRKIEQLKQELDVKSNGIIRNNKRIKQQLEQERRLFDMKWKMLEQELIRVAEDKRKLKKEREEYRKLKAASAERRIYYDMFFVGVNNEQSLKKRYKDLLKIFHPDNMNGDTAALQEINREYDSLRRILV